MRGAGPLATTKAVAAFGTVVPGASRERVHVVSAGGLCAPSLGFLLLAMRSPEDFAFLGEGTGSSARAAARVAGHMLENSEY